MRRTVVMRTAGGRWRAWIVAAVVVAATLAHGEEPGPTPQPRAQEPSPAGAPRTDEPTPEPSPVAAKGSVAGVVRATDTGKPIAGARIEILGSDTQIRSGDDGTFRVELPAGTYTVRIGAEGFSNRTIPKLVITGGKTARVEIKLSAPVKAEKDSVIVNVIARLRRAAEAAQLARRQKASAVSETISAETIKKSTGSDATAAVQRATGVTIREGGGSKTVFVRGLGERYTNAMLNGNRLPSPDALKRAVPLDLFPSDFLEGIDIVKGYTPDLPGDFAGGLVDMRLRDFPDTLSYSLGVATGGNSDTTGHDFLTDSEGGALDYFGMGEAARNWPHSTPAFSVSELPQRGRAALGRQFHNVWSPDTIRAPVDWGANFSIGDSIGPFGYQFGLVYADKWRSVRNELKRQFQSGGTTFTEVHSDRSTLTTRLGGILTSAYRLSDNHTLTLRSFFNLGSNDEARVESGTDPQRQHLDQTRLRYVEDELAYGQLGGEHRFDFILADWRTAFSRVTRDEPDTRHTTYTRPLGSHTMPVFTNQGLGGTRLANETLETLSDSALDFTIPFTTALPWTDVWANLPAKLKFGGAYSHRKRSFAQRRIEFDAELAGVDGTLPPEQIFDPKNFGPGGIDLDETTLPTDHFKGTHDILAGYGMLELPIVRDQLRLVGGARFEHSDIQLDTIVVSTDLCAPESSCPQSFIKKNDDVIPGVNLIYNPQKDMNVRLSWSETVSRPELRELAPSEFPAQRGDRATQGNPDLVEFHITSYDARWEWFFSPLELVSLGFFYKQIDRPIEKFTLYVSTDPIDTFANTGAATVYGFELEARKDFGFIRPALKDLSATINFTWAQSDVDVGNPKIFGFEARPTSPTRRMIGQAPYIANGVLEYAKPDWLTARLMYFTSERAIDTAGSDNFPDTYEERRDRLDFVLIMPLQRWLHQPLTAKLAVENILNDQVQYTQGAIVQRRYVDGVSFGASLTYTH
jgi:outer membrane receptor protein involved in Fe transport